MPSIIPNWDSTPQNQPSPKDAVWTMDGVFLSMDGISDDSSVEVEALFIAFSVAPEACSAANIAIRQPIAIIEIDSIDRRYPLMPLYAFPFISSLLFCLSALTSLESKQIAVPLIQVFMTITMFE